MNAGDRDLQILANGDDEINAAIEPDILPLCCALNSLPGVRTIWSCEGHPKVPMRPYVTFLADQKMAFTMDGLLKSGRQRGGLLYCWRIIASFREDGSLKYTIEPNDRRLNDYSPVRFWARPRWDQKTVRDEFKRLAALFLQIDA